MNLEADEFMTMMARPGRQEIAIAGRLVRPGCRVRLKPLPGGDILDLHLAGRFGVIEAIDEDDAGGIHVAVMLEDDPARDLSEARHPTHRFFFSPQELEPMDAEKTAVKQHRVLVAGIGNIFFGDDGFGVEVARRLLKSPLPAHIDVMDFGIRGMDLAYALGKQYTVAILVDALPGKAQPGTIRVIEPDTIEESAAPDAHRMNPVAVLSMAGRLGPLPDRVIIVGCETQMIDDPDRMRMGLSEAVAAAVEKAAEIVRELAAKMLVVKNELPQQSAESETEKTRKEPSCKTSVKAR